MPDIFTAPTVRAATGLSDVDLHRLTKAKVLKPRKAKRDTAPSRGRPAVNAYPPQEMLIAAIVAHLLKNRVSPRILRWVADDVRKQLYDSTSIAFGAYEAAKNGDIFYMFLAEVPSQERRRIGFGPDYGILDELPDDAMIMILPLHRLWAQAIACIKGAEA